MAKLGFMRDSGKARTGALNQMDFFQSQDEISKHAGQSLIYANWNPGDVRYEDINGDGVINFGNTL